MRLAIVLFGALAVATPSAAGSRRVDVGGFKLNLHCVGNGSPVVVLDAGAGDSSDTWDWVVPDVRRFTRVCTYDRAGLGKSDAGPFPRTSDRIADELERLLVGAQVSGPYVLVGHSFGGLNMRLFASRHPESVAGLVLVDATPEDFPAKEAALRTQGENEKLRTARSLGTPTFRSELDAMPASASLVRAARPTESQVVVLSAAHAEDSPAFRDTWAALQRQMVAAFPHARQVLADRSGHYIQYDQPELVVDAIRDLVNGSKTAPSPGPHGSSD
ncbi:MAG TPA: alpha/beta hydrolase [Candidatus Polarisedimenticolaceae bacterium]|nr:alpha/beta hydrolase [Candidatus Polarisedimenticolaceae bacterium]